MIDVVGAEARAHQLLEEVGLLVRALRRAEAGERALAVLVAQAGEAPPGELQRLFPGGLHQGAVPADQGMGEPLGMAGGMKAEEPLGAEVAVVTAGAVGGIDFD